MTSISRAKKGAVISISVIKAVAAVSTSGSGYFRLEWCQGFLSLYSHLPHPLIPPTLPSTTHPLPWELRILHRRDGERMETLSLSMDRVTPLETLAGKKLGLGNDP